MPCAALAHINQVEMLLFMCLGLLEMFGQAAQVDSSTLKQIALLLMTIVHGQCHQ